MLLLKINSIAFCIYMCFPHASNFILSMKGFDQGAGASMSCTFFRNILFSARVTTLYLCLYGAMQIVYFVKNDYNMTWS